MINTDLQKYDYLHLRIYRNTDLLKSANIDLRKI
jgi:hypothetical protein